MRAGDYRAVFAARSLAADKSERSAGTPTYWRPLELQTVVRKRGPRDEAGVVFEHLVLRPT